jgi:hypothetical protein
MMKRGLMGFAFVFVGVLSAMAQQSSAGAATPAASSAFLPMIGQSAQYEYSDTLTTPKGTTRLTATMTLTSDTARNIRASIAINGKESRSLDFLVDDVGALHPTSAPELAPESRYRRHRSKQSQQAAAVQEFVSRISLASRIVAHPAEETSFPVKTTVPGTTCPLNQTLVLKPTQPEALVADANDTTSISSPQANRRLLMPLGLGIGAGFIGGAIGGTPGRIAGISISATSLVVNLARTRHAGPFPADVSLHVDGKLADGRLQSLSGDQEVVVHTGKSQHTIDEKWSLVRQKPDFASLPM